MDEFKVKLDQMKSSANDNKQMARELSSIRNELYSVKRRLSFRISQRERIDRRLTMQGENLEIEKKKMDQITSALTDITSLYEKTEMELCGQKAPNGVQSAVDWLKDLFDWSIPWPGGNKIEELLKNSPLIIPSFLPFVVKPWIPVFVTVGNPPLLPYIIISSFFPNDLGDATIPVILTGLSTLQNGNGSKIVPWKTEWKSESDQNKEITSGTVESIISKAIKDAAKSEDGGKINNLLKKATDKYDKISDKVDKFSEDHTKTLGQKKTVYDTETKSWKTVDESDEAAGKAFDDELEASKMGTDVKATIFSAGGSAAVLSGEASTKGKYGSASAKASFGEREAHA